jgi:hypothetical protein
MGRWGAAGSGMLAGLVEIKYEELIDSAQHRDYPEALEGG